MHAIDAEPRAIEHVRAALGDAEGALETRLVRFEDATWPPADLVNSSFSLPFCPPHHFERVWGRVVESLPPGGRFSGQLFGERDEWAGDAEMSHRRAEALTSPPRPRFSGARSPAPRAPADRSRRQA